MVPGRCMKRFAAVVALLVFVSFQAPVKGSAAELDALIGRYEEKLQEFRTMRRQRRQFVRKELAPLLLKIGRVGTRESLQFLLGAFQKAEPVMAGSCAAGLFEDPEGRGLKQVLSLTVKKPAKVRYEVAEQLQKRRNRIKKHLPGVERELLVLYTTVQDSKTKIALVPVVGFAGTGKAASVLVASVASNKTVSWKETEKEKLSLAVVKAIAGIGTEDVTTYCARSLSRARDPQQVYVLLRVCERLAVKGVDVRFLFRLLQQGDGRIKVAAAALLLKQGAAGNVEKILAGLKRIRQLTAESCIQLFDTLALTGNEKALTYIHEAAQRSSPHTQAVAMGSFGLCPKSEQALSYLLEGLKSPHYYVRNAAVFSLERFRMKPMIPALIGLLEQEKNRNLRTRVLQLLISITGQNMGLRMDDWNKWWTTAGRSFSFAKKQGGTRVVTRDLQYFGIEIASTHIAFLLDASLSMLSGGKKGQNKEKRKIDVLKKELPRVISKLPEETFINIIPFHKTFVPWKEQLVPVAGQNRAKAIQFVKGITCRGGTNIYDTLAFALKDPSVDTIYLLSDGQPVGGTYERPDAILREIREINRVRRVVIHALCFGRENKFMKQIAAENNGTYRFVKEL